ncbi:MAG: ABC transporter ATP-binding protein, partial [Thermoprotei archaeon]
PENRALDYPHQLSGGMRQRVMIAISYALKPKLLIADEPTTALDVIVQDQILDLLKELRNRQKTSILFITHDLSVVADIADKVIIMYAGKIMEIGSVEQIYYSTLHPYTQGLLKSIPKIGNSGDLYTIPGNPPDMLNPPPGCRFHPRCPFAEEKCRKEEPPLIEVSEGHYVACWRCVK